MGRFVSWSQDKGSEEGVRWRFCGRVQVIFIIFFEVRGWRSDRLRCFHFVWTCLGVWTW